MAITIYDLHVTIAITIIVSTMAMTVPLNTIWIIIALPKP